MILTFHRTGVEVVMELETPPEVTVLDEPIAISEVPIPFTTAIPVKANFIFVYQESRDGVIYTHQMNLTGNFISCNMESKITDELHYLK